jgi:hypothetical protein
MSGYSQYPFAALRHIVVKTPPPFKRRGGSLRQARKRGRAACYLSEAAAVMHPAARRGGLHLRQRACPALICPVSGTLRHAPPRPARGGTSRLAATSGEHPGTTGTRCKSAYAWQLSASMPHCASRRCLSVITCPNGSAANLRAPDGESFRQRSARLHANRAIAKPMPNSPKDLRLQPRATVPQRTTHACANPRATPLLPAVSAFTGACAARCKPEHLRRITAHSGKWRRIAAIATCSR